MTNNLKRKRRRRKINQKINKARVKIKSQIQVKILQKRPRLENRFLLKKSLILFDREVI